MAKKQINKTVRKQIKLTEQLQNLMDSEMKSLGQSFNRLVDVALFMYYTDENNFISCPKCNSHLADLHTLNVGGMVTIDCSCGNHVVYDLDEDVFLKGIDEKATKF